MDADSFKLITPDGKTVVEAIFRTREGEEGISFYARVVVNGDIKHPLEELQTDDQKEFLRWMRKQAIEAMRRDSSGQRQEAAQGGEPSGGTSQAGP